MPITTIAIYFFIRPVNCMTSIHQSVAVEQTCDGRIRRIPQTIVRVFFEIFRIIINQGRLICFCRVNKIYLSNIMFAGGYFPGTRIAVYFVAGSWCLGALVLVCSYSSLLTSYILGSNAEPLVNSLNDLAGNSNVKLVVDKGLAVDIVVSVTEISKIKKEIFHSINL